MRLWTYLTYYLASNCNELSSRYFVTDKIVFFASEVMYITCRINTSFVLYSTYVAFPSECVCSVCVCVVCVCVCVCVKFVLTVLWLKGLLCHGLCPSNRRNSTHKRAHYYHYYSYRHTCLHVTNIKPVTAVSGQREIQHSRDRPSETECKDLHNYILYTVP